MHRKITGHRSEDHNQNHNQKQETFDSPPHHPITPPQKYGNERQQTADRLQAKLTYTKICQNT